MISQISLAARASAATLVRFIVRQMAPGYPVWHKDQVASCQGLIANLVGDDLCGYKPGLMAEVSKWPVGIDVQDHSHIGLVR